MSILVPATLAHVLLCVTFNWNVAKLVYLEAVLNIATSYQTKLEIIIVTNKASQLNAAVQGWGFNVSVWQAPAGPANEPYQLVWAHKQAIEEALARESYTSVVYMEDDTRLSWASLISWALDTEILEPLNYTRCFYRTEIYAMSGKRVMLDARACNITSVCKFDAMSAPPAAAYASSLSKKVAGKHCGTLRNGTPWQCQVHTRFYSPEYPFQGMWISTIKQLQVYMKSPYWQKNTAISARLPLKHAWGYPERSNSLNILIRIPSGCTSSCMVPYTVINGKPQLEAVAAVEHMRNGYSHEKGLVEVENALHL